MTSFRAERRCTLFFFLVFVIGVDFPLKGQVIIPRAADIYDEAEEYVLANDYREALSLYLNLYNKGYATANVSYKIGKCYLNLPGMKANAIPFLKEAVQHVSKEYTGESLDEIYAPLKSFLYLGIAYRIIYDFSRAENAFHTFIDSLDKEDEINLALAQYHLERIGNARELIASPAILKTDTLPVLINNALSNFNPLVTQDEKTLYYNEQLKFYDAVMQVFNVNGIWQEPENITPDIRSDGDHLVTGISPDGDRLLLYAHDAYLSGEIYMASYENGRWKSLQKLNDHINTQFNETHASFSADGATLYFTSDRPGGYGGLDIYRSELDVTGDWGPAQNLGPLINTAFNEETPFFAHNSEALFFSSQGHYNMGGYDIFYAQKTGPLNWQHPVNIGYPVNTPDDDIFYYTLPSGNTAYKSVFVNSSTDQNIVRYQVLSPASPARYTLLGRIDIQDSTGYTSSDIQVSVINNADHEIIGKQQLNKEGVFTQKVSSGSYTIEIAHADSLVYTEDIDIPLYFPHKELMFITGISIQSGLPADTLILRDLRFAFDNSALEGETKNLLDGLVSILLQYPELLVTLNGYTDALGSDSYNMKLSLERAANSRAYLLGQQIPQTRIFINGYGENNPVAINTDPDGKDSPEGRKYNRRVEIKFENIPEKLTILFDDPVPDSLRIK